MIERFKITTLSDIPHSNATGLGHDTLVKTLKKYVESEDITTPLSIAIHGDWGSGKTSVMKTLLSQIDYSKFDKIFFEAWKFEYANPALALIGTLIQKYEKDANTAKSIISAGAMILSNKFLNTDIHQLVDTIRGNTAKSNSFSDKIKKLLGNNLEEKKLLIVIDDLDRCDAENCLQLLSILKLFLDVEKVICIAAVDFNRLQKVWKQKYDPNNTESKHDSIDYLDKIFQVRIGLPEPTTKQIEDYLKEITSNVPEELIILLSRLCPKNPRSIKRILNLISYRKLLLSSDVKQKSTIVWTLFQEIATNRGAVLIYDYIKKEDRSFFAVIKNKENNFQDVQRNIRTIPELSDIHYDPSLLNPFFSECSAFFYNYFVDEKQFEIDFETLYLDTKENMIV